MHIFYKAYIPHIAHETLESVVAADAVGAAIGMIQIDTAEVLFEPGYLGKSCVGDTPVRHHGEQAGKEVESRVPSALSGVGGEEGRDHDIR